MERSEKYTLTLKDDLKGYDIDFTGYSLEDM